MMSITMTYTSTCCNATHQLTGDAAELEDPQPLLDVPCPTCGALGNWRNPTVAFQFTPEPLIGRRVLMAPVKDPLWIRVTTGAFDLMVRVGSWLKLRGSLHQSSPQTQA